MSLTSSAEIIHATSIGASQIAAVAGISPFDDQWTTYARILGLIPQKEQTEAMWWGTELEPLIAKRFSQRTGMPVEWWNQPIQSKRYPWQHASPDAFILESPDSKVRTGILECKTAGLRQSGEWDPQSDNEDGVPEHYVAQVQMQMTTCEIYRAYIAVLIAGQDFRIYEINHDPVLADILLQEGEDFWRMYLLQKVEPPISGSTEARDYLRKKYPGKHEELRIPTEKEMEILREYARVRHVLDNAEDRKKALETQIMQSIGDDLGLEWPGGKFTWKRTRDRSLTNWEELAKSQLVGFSEEEKAGFIEQYTNIEPGYRRIYFHEKENH